MRAPAAIFPFPCAARVSGSGCPCGPRYKLADLGVAHFFEEGGNDRLRKSDGTVFFVAPECTTGDEFAGFPTDVWALGITLHIMLTGRLPFVGSNEAMVQDAVRTQPYVPPVGLSADLADFLQRVLDKDPARRTTLAGMQVRPAGFPDAYFALTCPALGL